MEITLENLWVANQKPGTPQGWSWGIFGFLWSIISWKQWQTLGKLSVINHGHLRWIVTGLLVGFLNSLVKILAWLPVSLIHWWLAGFLGWLGWLPQSVGQSSVFPCGLAVVFYIYSASHQLRSSHNGFGESQCDQYKWKGRNKRAEFGTDGGEGGL